MFTGFPREAFDFFKSLERNNNRDWFQAHKDVYERACREPMKDLMAELEPWLGGSTISRINRDMRFVRDRSPYKTHIAAGIGGHYISLSKEGVYVGTGMYKPEPSALNRFRAAIDAKSSGEELQKIVSSLRRKGYNVDTHERVSSAPKGYTADHPRIDLLRMKDVFGGKVIRPGASLSTRNALDSIKRVITDIQPLRKWIQRHVGHRSG